MRTNKSCPILMRFGSEYKFGGADLESVIIFYKSYRFVGQMGLKRELNWPDCPQKANM